jgi:hypothetical protein
VRRIITFRSVNTGRQVIVLSEKDINRDTGSQTTDENALFNLTPEVMQSLCHKSDTNDENVKFSLPPRGKFHIKISKILMLLSHQISVLFHIRQRSIKYPIWYAKREYNLLQKPQLHC